MISRNLTKMMRFTNGHKYNNRNKYEETGELPYLIPEVGFCTVLPVFSTSSSKGSNIYLHSTYYGSKM